MKLYAVWLFCFTILSAASQTNKTSLYLNALKNLDTIAQQDGSFKQAVLITENIYDSNFVEAANFNYVINSSKKAIQQFFGQTHLSYKGADSSDLNLNFAIFHFLKDTIKVHTITGNGYLSKPFLYDFENYSGTADWHNMLLSKLFISHKGNCHSLPYFYKILADELGAKCWLSLAPNHIYIANRCQLGGWYNTELTTGTFPIDAWIMASGYVSLEAVQNGIYMDTLSNRESIALCMLDLAKEYEQTTKKYNDSVIIKCCDLSLKYFPNNVQAILMKAESLKKIFEIQSKNNKQTAAKVYTQMEILYAYLIELGYREMPDKMYQKWLMSIQKEKFSYN
jgi:hypothetical protein